MTDNKITEASEKALDKTRQVALDALMLYARECVKQNHVPDIKILVSDFIHKGFLLTFWQGSSKKDKTQRGFEALFGVNRQTLSLWMFNKKWGKG